MNAYNIIYMHFLSFGILNIGQLLDDSGELRPTANGKVSCAHVRAEETLSSTDFSLRLSVVIVKSNGWSLMSVE